MQDKYPKGFSTLVLLSAGIMFSIHFCEDKTKSNFQWKQKKGLNIIIKN